MRHPLRDLPSLLVRLGAIPKPVDQGSFSWEWEEWPRGDEAAAKLPDDPSAKFFQLGIVEEASGTAGEHGAGGETGGQNLSGQGSSAGGKTGTVRGEGGDKGRGKREGRTRGRGGEERVRGVECDLDERLLQQLLTKLLPLVQRQYPIVRCTADAEFVVEFAEHLVKPPACTHCKPCLAVYSRSIPFLTLIANYAYRPASILFNRFVSIFPPLSPEFDRVAARMGVPPFPASVPGFLRSALLQTQAELDPVLFLLAVAPKWAAPILGITDRKDLHRLRDGEEADGRVWEEVRMWWLAVEFAWQGSMQREAEALSDTCQGGKERAGRDGAQGEEVTSDKWRELWKRAAKPRFCEDIESERWVSEITGGSSNRSDDSFGSSSCSRGNDSNSGNRWTRGDDGKGKQGMMPSYSCRPTTAVLLLPSYYCRPTTAVLLLPSYYCRPTTAVLLLPSYYCRPTTAVLLLPSYSCRPTTAVLLLPSYYCRPTTAVLLLPSYYCRPTTAVLLLPSYYCRPTTAVLLLPSCSRRPSVVPTSAVPPSHTPPSPHLHAHIDLHTSNLNRSSPNTTVISRVAIAGSTNTRRAERATWRTHNFETHGRRFWLSPLLVQAVNGP
ncbi:unnamed protein product [Closterium sp. Yama58-4]|nr:unnamed protein product [Closterium sp. Yama58-4]